MGTAKLGPSALTSLDWLLELITGVLANWV
jgi:hypothetical protein